MTFQVVTKLLDDYKGRFISVYQPIAGWKAIMYWWNPELGGFWEPWETGLCGWETREQAASEGRLWAENEDLPFLETR